MTTQRRVLVVDDDVAIVDLLETALEDEGYQVFATVGAAALPLARDLQPAVILLDINMPGMDGIEVSQRLRDDPATAHIPIIVMSAQDRLRATGPLMPVNDRLPKPFDLTVLYATVARWAQAS
jgi:CheY-like chemotaxis protein